jgi:predicted flap endonuclease-1-like 5' DNA nuclease
MKSPSSTKPITPCIWPLEKLPGLGAKHQSQLSDLGLNTTGDLLKKMTPMPKRIQYGQKLRLPLQVLNKWIALSDLARIKSIGCQYNGLLLHAGVASVLQLSQMSAHQLHRQVLKLQVSLMQRRDLCPSVDKVVQWIDEAKQFNR